jgi:hypothetical protein
MLSLIRQNLRRDVSARILLAVLQCRIFTLMLYMMERLYDMGFGFMGHRGLGSCMHFNGYIGEQVLEWD